MRWAIAQPDWSQCPAVENAPGKQSGALVFRGTRAPVPVVFENLQYIPAVPLIVEFGWLENSPATGGAGLRKL
ncbi:MAG: hypothetical protein JNM66_18030 [Bryobacterales bacterium]|nr:hypothetical protein [Bryobacterales bacterium]